VALRWWRLSAAFWLAAMAFVAFAGVGDGQDVSVDQIIATLGPGAAPALALLFVLLWRRDLVFGWLYEEMRKDRDYWRSLHEKGMDVADKGVSAAEQAVSTKKGEG